VDAARVLRLEVCDVDMLDVKGRPLVFEVNGSPSIREAEAACGCDLAGKIVDRALAVARERQAVERPAARRAARGAPVNP
jgi:ribosomal protein S6--L-glutamate ligase